MNVLLSSPSGVLCFPSKFLKPLRRRSHWLDKQLKVNKLVVFQCLESFDILHFMKSSGDIRHERGGIFWSGLSICYFFPVETWGCLISTLTFILNAISLVIMKLKYIRWLQCCQLCPREKLYTNFKNPYYLILLSKKNHVSYLE